MTLRADHVAGAAFFGFGLLIIALSGDLPTGQLSMPGSGFLPKLVAVLMILFGILLALRGAESEPFARLDWGDAPHAAQVVAITAAGIALYTVVGFILSLTLMILALLVVIERRSPIRALGYSLGAVLFTYVSFEYLLKTPLPPGPFGF